MFSLESPHLGNSNEYTQYIIFNIMNEITLNYTKPADKGFFLALVGWLVVCFGLNGPLRQ